MTWWTGFTSLPRAYVALLISGIAFLVGVLVATDLSPVQQIAITVGLLATVAALLALVRFLVSRETHRTQALLDALPNPTYLKTTDGKYHAVNSAWEHFFGIPRIVIAGKATPELDPAERVIVAPLDASDQNVRQRTGFHVYEDVLSGPDGSRHDAIVCKAACITADGKAAGLVGTIIDVTDRKKAERRLAMEHAVTRVLADAENLDNVVPTIIATICATMGWHYGAMYKYHSDQGMLRCEHMWGIDTPQIREFIAAVGRRSVRPEDDPGRGIIRRAFALRKPVWISNIAIDETLRRKALVVKAGLHGAFAFPVRAGNQVLGILEFFHAEVLEPDATLLDIAESIGGQIGQYIVRRRTENEKHRAMHDVVTGLPTRLLFMERLEHAVVQAQRHDRRLAVMFIDLDRFKLVNDTFGHEAGDVLLREMSRRLKLSLRQGDTVARLGGDEFVMLLEEITNDRDILLIGQKLIAELGAPFSIGSNTVTVTASIGVSIYPADATDPATLLRHADAAMYRAKANGRNLCQLYSNETTPSPRQTLRIVKGE
jgi:diguanylate cyclase (GGDEF)-like protein/PAS domain S-box-containing protein